MAILGLVLLLAVNFGISWWNCKVIGRTWVESKAIGGWIRLVDWSGAVMAALGFSSVYVALLGLGLYGIGYLDEQMVELVLSLWYILAVIPLLSSGLILTIESWRRAARDHSLISLGTAGWNTYAQIHNTMQAFDGLGHALSLVGKAISSAVSDSDDVKTGFTLAALIVAALIVAIAILGGVLHTVILIKKYAASDPVPDAIAEHSSALAAGIPPSAKAQPV